MSLHRPFLCFARRLRRGHRLRLFRPRLEVLEPRAVPALLDPGSGSEILGVVFYDSDSQVIDSFVDAGLKAGASAEITRTVTIPTSPTVTAADGKFTLSLQADPDDAVAESDETNNVGLLGAGAVRLQIVTPTPEFE